MKQTLEAVIDPDGRVRLLEEVKLDSSRRGLVVVLDDPPGPVDEATLLSEPALAEDWDRPEEDEAWAHLGSEP